MALEGFWPADGEVRVSGCFVATVTRGDRGSGRSLGRTRKSTEALLRGCGTEGSNPASSSEESSTNPTFGCTSSDHAPVPIEGNGRPCQGDRWFESLYRSRSR